MVTWVRGIYNAYEPDNRLVFKGTMEQGEEGRFLRVRKATFAGSFRDGPSFCGLERHDDGWHWHNNDKDGVCNTYHEAWSNLPALVTHPDHWEWLRQEGV